MHMKLESDLFPIDTELERTLRSLRKVSASSISYAKIIPKRRN